MPSGSEIQQIMDALAERYGDVHGTFKHLRRFWEGHMWEDQDQMARSLGQVFRDLRHGYSEDREPDVKVTLPLIESVVTKWMSLLAPPPQISVLTPPEGYVIDGHAARKEEIRRGLADENEKYLYGCWEGSNVSFKFKQQAWFLPLMGCCFNGVYPDFETNTVRYITRSPEVSFPIWDEEFEYLAAIGFRWKVSYEAAKRRWPDAHLENDIMPTRRSSAATSARGKEIIVTEWWDKGSKTLMLGNDVYRTVDHGLGFCPWTMASFYLVPGFDFGKGVIEGNVGLFQKMNMLDSLELQAIIENVFARLVLINPAMAPEDIDNGPGAVIPIGAGGDAKWLTPPPTTIDLSKSMARSTDFYQRGTHLPGSMYGESLASSITTGKAQHESVMPTGTMAEYVQGNIGYSWERLNEMNVAMAEAIFPNTEIKLFGRQFEPGFLGALQGAKPFTLSMKGSDLQGWSRHVLTFQPSMNMHEKIVMGLQLAGGGLVSKRWQRDQIGISDNTAMEQEIAEEMARELQLGIYQQMLANGQMTPEQLEGAFMALEKGGLPNLPNPNAMAPPGGMPAGPGGMLPPGGMPGAPGPASPGPGGLPPQAGGPAPNPLIGGGAASGLPPAVGLTPDLGGGGPPATATQGGQFELQQAISDFQSVKKVKGRVFLVGEIVTRGSTDGPVEVAITNPIDKATLVNGLPDTYRGNLTFHTVQGEPQEDHVEVTPGTAVAAGGGSTTEHPNAVAATGGLTPLAAQGTYAEGRRNPPLASSYPLGGPQGSLRS